MIRHSVRRSLATTALALGLAAALPASAVDDATRAAFAGRVFFPHDTAKDTRHDGFIVYLHDDAAASDDSSAKAIDRRRQLDRMLATASKSLATTPRHTRRLATGGHLVEFDGAGLDARATEAFMRALAADPALLSVEPNLRLHIAALPNDTLLFAQWGLTEAVGGINVEPAWDGGNTGYGVLIAVIDTGQTAHPDLDAKTFPGIDMISDPGNSRDGHGRDGDPSDMGDWNEAGQCGENAPERGSTWHGTHVAGIAAAITHNADGIAGVAPGANLQHVRVLGTCGGSTADIADGIVWASGGAVPGVPTNPTPARVLNLSLGGLSECSTTYQTAINSARSRNSVVIVAAGNDNVPASLATPANCNGVVTVAATGRTGARAVYSNYGPTIDVAAPGGDSSQSADNGILSTLNLGFTSPAPSPTGAYYDMKDGTSMAAPFVAGIAALMIARNNALTPDQIETMLRDTARPFPTYCSGGCGSGIVDAAAAVSAAAGNAPTQRPLSVALYGSGQGSVTSSPAGINCGTTGVACSARFNANGTVTLTATAPAGSVFGGWSGPCSGMSTTCSVSMSQSRAVYATFNVPAQALSNGTPLSGLAGSASQPRYFTLDVPAGASNLVFAINGGSGDADLHVRRASAPTTQTFDCRPYLTGNNETCSFPAPAAGTWHVMLTGDPDFSGVTLRGSYTTGGTPGGDWLFCDGMEAGAAGCN